MVLTVDCVVNKELKFANTQNSVNDLFLQADQLTEEQIAGEYI